MHNLQSFTLSCDAMEIQTQEMQKSTDININLIQIVPAQFVC